MKMPIAEFYLDSFVHFETFLRTILLTHGVSLFSATSYLPQQVRFRLCSNMPRKIDAITVQREMLEYYFVHGGYTISGIADGRNGAPHKVKRRTLSRWIQWYLTWDCPPAHNQKLLNLNNGATYLTTEQLEALRRFVLDNPTLYLDEIQHRLPELDLPIVSITTLRNYLKNHLNLSHRKLLRVAQERSEIRRAQYLEEISLYSPEQLVFVDETQKQIGTTKRQRGWAICGSDAKVLEFFLGRTDFTFSLIAAADIDGWVAGACMPVEKSVCTVTGDLFIEYLRTFLLPLCNSFESGLNRSVIVLDNATVHPPQEVENLCAEYGVHVVWTAPYSPDLNPIEYFFRVYKASMRRLILVCDEQTAHYNALCMCLNKEIIRNVYAHVGLIKREKAQVLSDEELVKIVSVEGLL